MIFIQIKLFMMMEDKEGDKYLTGRTGLQRN